MKLLFVDDDIFFGHYYVKELVSQFADHTVDAVNTVDMAITYVKQDPELKAIVLDVMMAKPIEYNIDVGIDLQDGINTGIWFLSYLRANIIDRGIKVLTISNRNLPEVERQIALLKFPAGTIASYRKADLSAERLPTMLRVLLSGRS